MATLKADSTPGLFAAAPGTGGTSGDGTNVGRDSDEKLGFYGKTPISRPTITVANSGAGTAGAILVALGLAEQIP